MKKVSEETRRRMSDSAKRRCAADQFKQRMAQRWIPFCTVEELREHYITARMTIAEIAIKFGVSQKRVQTSLRRCQVPMRKATARNQRLDKGAGWKGEEASYKAKHQRVYTSLGAPKRCDVCGSNDPAKYYDWANLSGNYNSIEDYRRMCRSCHRKYDNARRVA